MTRISYSSLHIDPENNNKSQELDDATSTRLKCFGYRSNRIKIAIYCFLNLVLVGIPYLIGRWCVQWKVYFTASPIFLRNATIVLIKDEDQFFSCDVHVDSIDFLPNKFAQRDLDPDVSDSRLEDEETSETTPLRRRRAESYSLAPLFRHFNFRHENYFWDEAKGGFRKLEGLEGITAADLLESYPGLSDTRRRQLRRIYGPNLIDVEVKGYVALLFDEVLNPFYVFQIFSISLWCFDDYYYYAACVVVISFISITMSLLETRRQMESLREMAIGQENLVVGVRKPNAEEEEICVQDLVPGDVILVPPEGLIMPCDAVVTTGSCIVNESMLTGESIPVRKTPISETNEFYDIELHKRHTVFAGTHVIQTRFYGGNKISCVVVRTGFSTLKGSLIRSMLFPKETGLDFYQDAIRFVILLFMIAMCGMAYCAYVYIIRHASFQVLIVRVLDIVTIVVPPALPAALTVGTVYAQARLKLRGIFCISPPKINFCGKLQLICFDKTGTLTEDGLDFASVVPTDGDDLDNITFLEPLHEVRSLPDTSELARCMATCHSLTHIKGNLVGDPLDLKMFEATGWELVEPLDNADERRFDLLTPTFVKKNDIEVGIIREFEFTPQLQRMSVVVKALDLSGTYPPAPPVMTVYCKGSPEKVSSLCDKLPEDYDLVLDSYTVRGYRVLALGRKNIFGFHWHQVQRASRETIEKDLVFVGFLIMQNSLKSATIPVIRELKNAELRSVMVTGDNALTALSVARECGMISSCDKVVIVNALESGEIEFTLAAHHYEAEDSTVEGGSQGRRASGMTARSISSSGSERPPSFLGSERSLKSESLSGHSALDEDDEDDRIDVDRLIPITGGAEGSELAPSFISMESNYHFVVTGKSWDMLYRSHPKSTLHRILAKGTVYARMSPEWKMQLVESLQSIGYVTGMCGDGANDCSALKMAHVGISLSEAEASVAAPFTSRIADISCVPHLVREGRCALVTSFGMFKYMALYSLVQFITVLSLYRLGSNLADTEFLFIDLVITTTLAIVMGRTEPYGKIVAKRPIGNLSSVQNVISIICQIVVTASIQVGALEYLQAQPWYEAVRTTSADDTETTCWENTTLFCVSAFQYLILALVFSKGPPFRKPFFTNGCFVVCLAILTSFTTLVTIHPYPWLGNFMGLMPLDPLTTDFRYSLMIFPLLNLIISLTIETLLSVGGSLKGKLGRGGFKKSKAKYQEILQQIESDVTWPRVKCS